VILGLDRQPAARHFRELDDALSAMTTRTVCLNAHLYESEAPRGAVIYNLETVGEHVKRTAFRSHEIWDFSERNVKAWARAGVKYVPVGYHPSMKRFELLPWEERDIDVVFCGLHSERREKLLLDLADRGLSVLRIPPGTLYGAKRDAHLARAKVALNMLYYPNGTFPVLRAAHCAANGLPFVSEVADETPRWARSHCVPYETLPDVICAIVNERDHLEHDAGATLEMFKASPLTLPEAA
jgi:hypothetical protein